MPPTSSGSSGGHQAAEEHERQQQEDREGEHLGPRQVVGDLLVDLRAGDHLSAQGHPGDPGHRLLEALGQRVVAGVLTRSQGHREVGRSPVAGHQRRARLAEGGHPRHVAVGTQDARRLGHPLLTGSRPRALGRAHQRDHVDVGSHAARLGGLLGLGHLGGRVLGAVGVQPVRHRATEYGGRDRQHDGERHDALRASGGQGGEGAEHGYLLASSSISCCSVTRAPLGDPLLVLDAPGQGQAGEAALRLLGRLGGLERRAARSTIAS